MSKRTSERIPIAGPWITDKEISYVADAAANGWYENAGYYVQRFEEAFAAYIDVKHAIAVPHCTSAIHLALASLGISAGDEVIVPEITWIASAAPVRYVGATPVFADIDPVTWCMSVEAVRALVTPRTKAIIPVGLYGLMPDMAGLRTLADGHGLHIIEDAAQTLGSRQHGRMAGSYGDVGVFSFHGTKTLTTGEGGMFVTNDTALYERALVLRDHGRGKSNHRNFFNTEVGYKYRMSSLQAAFGTAQLERIGELLHRKRQIFTWYAERLAAMTGLQFNVEPAGYHNTYWMTTVVLDPDHAMTTADLMAAFDARGIDVRPFFHPLSKLPAFADAGDAAKAQLRNSVAYALSPRGINLPSALRLVEDDVDRVCVAFKDILCAAHAMRRARRS